MSVEFVMVTRPFGAASARLFDAPDLFGLMDATSNAGRSAARGAGAGDWADMTPPSVVVARTSSMRKEVSPFPAKHQTPRFVAGRSVVPNRRICCIVWCRAIGVLQHEVVDWATGGLQF